MKRKQSLICISGGQDSTFLLLKNLMDDVPVSIYLNHLNYKTQFLHTHNFAKIQYFLKLKCHCSTPFFPLKNETSSACWRYSIIHRTAQYYQYKCIYLGKTQTDYIEKYILHLLQGRANLPLPSLREPTHCLLSRSYLIK